jgi:hypothetical protein
MKRIVVILLLVALGWQGYVHFSQRRSVEAQQAVLQAVGAFPDEPADRSRGRDADARSRINGTNGHASSDRFRRCDGRTKCSQMTSCEEATYFLQHCPGAEMEGNHDGVPCERQWCGR